MSAKWGQGWVKLYRSPSPSWLALPYSARGLGYELLRVCDDEGRIDFTGVAPFEAVTRLCVISGHEKRLARKDFNALLADGFVSVDGNFLVVRNFRPAQETLSPAAAKKAAQRARLHPSEELGSGQTPTDLDRSGLKLDRNVTNLAEVGSKPNESEPNPAETLASQGDNSPIKEETKNRLEEKREGGAGETIPPTPPTNEPQSGLPGIEPKAPKRKRPAKQQPTPDPEPLQGSVAKQVRDAIVADSVLAPITNGPGDFAIRSCAEGAYPGVDVLAEVRRAGEYASRFPGKYRDGRSFLSGWLRRAAEDFARKPKPAGLQPAAPSTAFTAATTAGKPVPGQLAMQRFYPTRAKTAEGEQS